MSEDLDVALQLPATDTGAEASLVTSRGTAGPRAGDDPAVAPPDSTTAIRDQRVISDATRKAIARIAAMGKQADTTVDVGDDLVPMEHDTNAAKPAPATAAAPKPSPAPVAAAIQAPPAEPAPVSPTAQPAAVAQSAAQAAEIMARAEAERLQSEHAQRVKQLEAREAALAAREKLLPDRARLAERPGAALADILRNALGLTDKDDAELKEAISDLVTEASMEHLGVTLPDEVKLKLEGRKALRAAKAYNHDFQRQKAELAAEREAQAKADREAAEQRDAADRERKAIVLVGELVGGTKESHPFLHAAGELGLTDPTSVVVDLIRAQRARGEQADWQAAVKLADDHFRPKVEAAVKKSAALSTLLNPTPATQPAAAAPAAPATQQVGEQVRRPTTLTATPTAPANPETPPDDGTELEDRYDRRHRQLRSTFAKHRTRFQPADG